MLKRERGKLKIVNKLKKFVPLVATAILVGAIVYMLLKDIAIADWVFGLLITVVIYWWGELTGTRVRIVTKITSLIKSKD